MSKYTKPTGGFKKGNPGKPKGAVSFAHTEKRLLIEYLKDQGAQKFIEELDKLEGKEFCKMYVPVIELAFPKLSRQEITGKDGKDLIPQPILDVRKNNSDRKD